MQCNDGSEKCPACLNWTSGSVIKAVATLRAEIVELREALEAIADGSCYDTEHDIRKIARAALTKGADRGR